MQPFDNRSSIVAIELLDLTGKIEYAKKCPI